VGNTCIACAMPMEKPEDYAMADEDKEYCVHCARPDGSMQCYEEKLDSMSQFLIKTQGLDEVVARRAAKSMMANLPAWKDV